ncbi:nuclear pore complex assembly-domain-containing protein [Aspergillus cavernicola]|uniref:Nuclear pore complex assembly-domain-containing protein n=1 Tax=Aspergillus cavernicola TaxID=176166 RepID=A0ABR4HMU2_9EURO
MAPWEEFDAIFHFNKNFTYDGKVIEQILSNRRALENQLFADRLLELLSVPAVTKLYPPISNSDLRSLIRHIVSSELEIHQKQSLIYYILKDCRSPNDAATQFARRCHLPEKYRLFIDGLWSLDRLEFKRAIEYLTEPSLIPTFPDEILYTLTLSHLPRHDDSLVMAYYLTVNPPLASGKAQRAFMETLCRASIAEAFYFTRKHNETLRLSYFTQLIEFVHRTDAGQIRSRRAMELIDLPFDDQEEEWFEDTLLRGNAKTLRGAKDTVMMRRLATGKLSELSTELESLGGKKIDGLNWDVLKQSMEPTRALAERCKYEHPGRQQQTFSGGNRFGALSGGSSFNNSRASSGQSQQSQQSQHYGVTDQDIKADLSTGKGRPDWIFSCYGPGRNAPRQLFGGPQRELSFEELRLRHYDAAATGNPGPAIQEAETLYNEAVNQMEVILKNIDAAVKYITDGAKEHPNRIDIVKGNTDLGTSQGPSAFGQPSALSQTPAFAPPGFAQQASSQPSFGQPSFGQPSLGQASGFGQPSVVGPSSSFGQPAFGQSSFGQPSLGQSSFDQPSSMGTSAFSQASGTASPFSQISSQTQAPSSSFGQPSPFAQAAQQPSGFGQPSTIPATTSDFATPSQSANPFGQPQAPFGQSSQGPSPFGAAAQQAAPSAFGQPAGGAPQPAAAPSAPVGAGPAGVLKIDNPNDLNPIPPPTGETRRDPMTKKLMSWKGQPVKYINNEPCYLHPQDQKTAVRIFFPDGPPVEASLRDAQANPDQYTPEIAEQYEFFVKNGFFKDGLIPSVPPKTEWVSFDF